MSSAMLGRSSSRRRITSTRRGSRRRRRTHWPPGPTLLWVRLRPTSIWLPSYLTVLSPWMFVAPLMSVLAWLLAASSRALCIQNRLIVCCLCAGGGYSNGQPQSFAALAEAVRLNLTNASLVDRAFGKHQTTNHLPPATNRIPLAHLTSIFFDQPPQTPPTTSHIPLLVDELGIVLRRRAACLRAAQARSAGPTLIEPLHQDPSKRCQLGGESGAGGADGAGGGGAADQPEEDAASGEQRKCCRS